MTLGIFYSSYNNYDLLLDECINKIDFEDIEVINIDDHSIKKYQEIGRRICADAEIPFFINPGKGLHSAADFAINYFKDKNVSWVLCMQQDIRPLDKDFFMNLSKYLRAHDTSDLGALGFNVLYESKYTKQAYANYLIGKRPQGWLGTFPLSDKRTLFQKAFIYDLIKFFIKKVLSINTAHMIHVYRRWFSEATFKNFKNVSKKYKGLVSIDLPAWPAVVINVDLWEKFIKPDENYIFHLWFNDIAFQFMKNNIYVGLTSDFYIFNNQKVKTKYGMEESSADEGKKKNTIFFEPYGDHLKYFKKKWGFCYEKIIEEYPLVEHKYKGTLIDKTFQHSCINGPLKKFKKR